MREESMRTELIVRKRLLMMLVALAALFCLVGVRIGSLTILQGEALTARGVRQWTREGVVAAQRGAIQDTNGNALALSATAYIVTANPQWVEDEAEFAAVMAPLLNADAAAMENGCKTKSWPP